MTDLLTRLKNVDTSCLCDAKKTLRTLDPALRPIGPGLKMVGRARTVPRAADFLCVLHALRDAVPGEVLVVDGRATRHALAGGLFSTEAHRKGLAGLVIDGAVRDVSTIRQLRFPVYARAMTPMADVPATPAAGQEPIQCGGVTIAPGELIVGDDDGVVVGSEEEIAGILSTAEEIQRHEAAALEQMASGRSLLTLLNVDEHLEALAAHRPSRLRFVR